MNGYIRNCYICFRRKSFNFFLASWGMAKINFFQFSVFILINLSQISLKLPSRRRNHSKKNLPFLGRHIRYIFLKLKNKAERGSSMFLPETSAEVSFEEHRIFFQIEDLNRIQLKFIQVFLIIKLPWDREFLFYNFFFVSVTVFP